MTDLKGYQIEMLYFTRTTSPMAKTVFGEYKVMEGSDGRWFALYDDDDYSNTITPRENCETKQEAEKFTQNHYRGLVMELLKEV